MNKDLENKYKRSRKINEKGITLIALIVTIIILLILAGITINLTLGENGIIKTAKEAGESYKITQIKEIIESEIIAMDAEKIVKGEDLTVEQALIGIKENGIFEEIDLAEESGIREGYIIQLGYNENGKVVILGIEKDTGTRLEITLNPTGYTNENVEVSITAKSNKSNITDIEVPQEMEKKENGTYEVSKNGTYHVIANLDNGQTIEKDIKIGNIDKLAPKDFSIEIEKDGGNITIIENAEDADATEESTESGIDYYEYYIIDNSNKETKYNTNIITNLALGTYKIYVIAYDKAGNKTKSSENTIEITMVIDKLASGCSHYLAIDKEGNLWVEGYNNFGQLGIGNTNNTFNWTQIMGNTKFKEIDVAEYSSYAIDIDGNLYSWGYNYYGNLGDGTTTDSRIPIKIKEGTKFKKIETSNENNAGKICTAIDINDNLWIWGTSVATIINGETMSTTYEPIKILEDIKFKEISVGSSHYLAIDEGGNLWTWGGNSYGQLGPGRSSDYWTPTKIQEDKKFTKVYASSQASFAIDEEGNLYSWGRNWYGLLGINNSENDYRTNELQKIILDSKAVAIDGSGAISVAILDENGCVWTIGQDANIASPDSRAPYKQELNTKIKNITIGRRLVCTDNNNDTWVIEHYNDGFVVPTQKTANLFY